MIWWQSLIVLCVISALGILIVWFSVFLANRTGRGQIEAEKPSVLWSVVVNQLCREYAENVTDRSARNREVASYLFEKYPHLKPESLKENPMPDEKEREKQGPPKFDINPSDVVDPVVVKSTDPDALENLRKALENEKSGEMFTIPYSGVLARLPDETADDFKRRFYAEFYNEGYYGPNRVSIELESVLGQMERASRFWTMSVADLAGRLRAFLVTKGGQVVTGPEVNQVFRDPIHNSVNVAKDHIRVTFLPWISPINAVYERFIVAQGDYIDKKWYQVATGSLKETCYAGSTVLLSVEIERPELIDV